VRVNSLEGVSSWGVGSVDLALAVRVGGMAASVGRPPSMDRTGQREGEQGRTRTVQRRRERSRTRRKAGKHY